MNVDVARLQELGLMKPPSAQKPRNELGQEDFLKLMTTQMTHQNPLKPMENTEFLTQLAQFGTVNGIQALQQSFADFANAITADQALQAAGLVGRQVLVEGNQARLAPGGELQGALALEKPAAGVTVRIVDTSGQVVRTLELGPQDSGRVPFVWDGLKDDGDFAEPGTYQIQAEGMVEGENRALTTLVPATVESVSTAENGYGLTVDLEGLGSVDIQAIKQIL